MDYSVKFWDRIAKRYAKQPIADEAAYRKKLKLTREYLQPDMKVLEIGCGTGSTAILQAPYVKHIRAIDYSEKMIAIAQAKLAETKINNVSFEQLSVGELDVDDEALDVVLGLNLLHLVEDRDATIDKVYRILKSNGLFITSTVCLADFMKYFKYVAPLVRLLRVAPLVKVFSAKELEASLVRAGFKIDYSWLPGKKTAIFIVAKK